MSVRELLLSDLAKNEERAINGRRQGVHRIAIALLMMAPMSEIHAVSRIDAGIHSMR